MTAPVPPNENERLRALYECDILDTAPEEVFDDITRLAAQICDTPIAAVSLIDEERQWFKSSVGLSGGETPRAAAFCAYTILQTELLVVPDAQADPRFADNPQVTGPPFIRFYAGAPLISDEGQALGSLCVIDRTPRTLTPDQETTLRLLARQVCSHLRAARRAAERERAEAALARTHTVLRAVLESAPLILYAADADGTVTLSEGTGLAALGLRPSEAVGHSVFEFSAGVAENEANARRALAGEAVSYDARVESIWLHTEIRPLRDADGALAGIIGVCLDVTERIEAEERVNDHAVVLEFQELQKSELEKTNAELASLATTDGLTGLKNHRAFQERLAEEVSRTARYGTPLSLVLLDVDKFKHYNDTHGHPARGCRPHGGGKHPPAERARHGPGRPLRRRRVRPDPAPDRLGRGRGLRRAPARLRRRPLLAGARRHRLFRGGIPAAGRVRFGADCPRGRGTVSIQGGGPKSRDFPRRAGQQHRPVSMTIPPRCGSCCPPKSGTGTRSTGLL